MPMRYFTFGCVVVLALGSAGVARSQDGAAAPQSAQQELKRIHGPRSIEQELDRLTKDLELTPEQQKQVRPLLQEHHDKIQALLDKNPTLTRRELAPQIHAISDETHHEINALLTDHQKDLAKAMQRRERNGDEQRWPAPPPSTPQGTSGL